MTSSPERRYLLCSPQRVIRYVSERVYYLTKKRESNTHDRHLLNLEVIKRISTIFFCLISYCDKQRDKSSITQRLVSFTFRLPSNWSVAIYRKSDRARVISNCTFARVHLISLAFPKKHSREESYVWYDDHDLLHTALGFCPRKINTRHLHTCRKNPHGFSVTYFFLFFFFVGKMKRRGAASRLLLRRASTIRSVSLLPLSCAACYKL